MKNLLPLFLLLPLLKISAQCEDSFNSGSINALWNFTSNEFLVNGNEQLQLQSNGAGFAAASWNISDCSNEAVEWRFYIKQSFAGSTNNYGKIFLSHNPVIDSGGYETGNNSVGYMIRLGSAGSNDVIEFFRTDGPTSPTLLMSGFNISSGINGWIKIRKFNGFELYFMDNDSVDYTLVGATTDNTYNTFNFLSWQCYFTSSNSSNFYLDDCYSGPVYIPPVAYEPSFREVVINEIMADPSPSNGLPDIEYVELYNNAPFPISLQDWQWVNSSTIKPITNGSIDSNGYAILCDLSAVFNFTGNVIGIESFGLLTNGGDSLSLLSPAGELVDFVVYNLNDYENDEGKEGGWSLEQIRPHLACSDHFNWKQSCHVVGGTPGIQNCQYGNGDPEEDFALVDFGIDTLGRVFLWTNRPILQDSIAIQYNQSEYHLPLHHLSDSAWFTAGEWMDSSMQNIKIHHLNSCLSDTLSHIQFAIGKPQNIQPKEIFISEVLSHPYENGSSFVELFNSSPRIVTLDELHIENANGDNNCIAYHHHFIAPKTAICVSEKSDVVREQYPPPPAFVACYHSASLPYFTQSAGQVTLKNRWDKVMETMEYNEEIHHPIIYDPQGVSFERIKIPCPQNDGCWTSGAEHYGFATPGYFIQDKNWPDQELNGDWSLSSEWFSPNNDMKNDQLFIRRKGSEENHLITIQIHAIDGWVVRHLTTYELNLQAAEWMWDGMDDNGVLCPAGIYFLHIEDQPNSSKKKEIIKSIVLSP